MLITLTIYLSYKAILESFSELKILHGYYQSQDLVLFSNKDILVGGRPIYFDEWFKRGVVFINDLLNENGKFLFLRNFLINTNVKLTSFSINK